MMNKYFRTIILSFFFLATAHGQQMMPPVGTIDFFGLRRVSKEDVSAILKIEKGDDAMKILVSVEENRRLLKSLPFVEDSSISVVCCDDTTGKSIVYVGIRETGTPALSFRSAPKGKIRLPASIVRAGKDFQAAFIEALKGNDFSEDGSQGHALAGSKNVRQAQERFVTLAAPNLKVLRRVLRESSDAGQRALAAQIMAYARDKKKIVGDLIFGIDDPDTEVRNNSTRALIVLAIYARANPALNIKIPSAGFVRMLNSVDWTDRNKSIGVLETLTAGRDADLLAELKSQALDSLIEMSGWKNPGHAENAFFILGRIGNFSEAEIDTMRQS